jgi:outer membrane protein assembly factor BamD (BamD/ComL family)
MRLVERGDYAAGAERLEAYRRAHPGDARAEDAAYMTVLALQRAGRKDEAAAAAKRYLGDFPQGYRRAEMQAIAQGNGAASGR